MLTMKISRCFNINSTTSTLMFSVSFYEYLISLLSFNFENSSSTLSETIWKLSLLFSWILFKFFIFHFFQIKKKQNILIMKFVRFFFFSIFIVWLKSAKMNQQFYSIIYHPIRRQKTIITYEGAYMKQGIDFTPIYYSIFSVSLKTRAFLA